MDIGGVMLDIGSCKTMVGDGIEHLFLQSILLAKVILGDVGCFDGLYSHYITSLCKSMSELLTLD